jgi:hypothetical protein
MITYSAHQNNRGVVLLAAALTASFTLSGELTTQIPLAALVQATASVSAELQTRITFQAFLQSRVGINAILAGTQQILASDGRTLRILFEDRTYIVKA